MCQLIAPCYYNEAFYLWYHCPYLAVAAPTSAAIVARVEGEITNARARNSTDLVPRAGTGGPRPDWLSHRRLVQQGDRHHPDNGQTVWVSQISGMIGYLLICAPGTTTGPSPSTSVVKPSTEIVTVSSAFLSMDAILAE
ncbi:hypothetical protein B0H10DRAFT_1962233 [Mycena sp. CBHHK59/15]|nr:hypothetical protein B0H10DRAFT_1962233 [Mycena sp. CBHHK59/15]